MAEEKWEYISTMVNASIDIEGAKEHIKNRCSKWAGLRKHSTETVVPTQNKFGKDGWKLVHMQPAAFDDDGTIGKSDWFMDICFSDFKRKKKIECHTIASNCTR